jgi:hypothetical protein
LLVKEVSMRLLQWAEKSKPGAEVVYHKSDRPRDEKDFAQAWKLYEAGTVALFQRRTPTTVLEYIAVRTSQRAHDFLEALP